MSQSTICEESSESEDEKSCYNKNLEGSSDTSSLNLNFPKGDTSFNINNSKNIYCGNRISYYESLHFHNVDSGRPFRQESSSGKPWWKIFNELGLPLKILSFLWLVSFVIILLLIITSVFKKDDGIKLNKDEVVTELSNITLLKPEENSTIRSSEKSLVIISRKEWNGGRLVKPEKLHLPVSIVIVGDSRTSYVPNKEPINKCYSKVNRKYC